MTQQAVRKRRSRIGYRRSRRSRTLPCPYSRSEILARWDGACCYCDAPAEHLDHVKPISRGGADAVRNLVPACARCNLDKGAQTLAEWVLSWRVTDPLDPVHEDMHKVR